MPAITIDDDLARRLDQQARQNHATLAEWVSRILRSAATREEFPEEWQTCESRRVELIVREMESALTADESLELERLQAASAKLTEPYDRQRLDWLANIESQAEALAGDSDA